MFRAGERRTGTRLELRSGAKKRPRNLTWTRRRGRTRRRGQWQLGDINLRQLLRILREAGTQRDGKSQARQEWRVQPTGTSRFMLSHSWPPNAWQALSQQHSITECQ